MRQINLKKDWFLTIFIIFLFVLAVLSFFTFHCNSNESEVCLVFAQNKGIIIDLILAFITLIATFVAFNASKVSKDAFHNQFKLETKPFVVLENKIHNNGEFIMKNIGRGAAQNITLRRDLADKETLMTGYSPHSTNLGPNEGLNIGSNNVKYFKIEIDKLEPNVTGDSNIYIVYQDINREKFITRVKIHKGAENWWKIMENNLEK